MTSHLLFIKVLHMILERLDQVNSLIGLNL